MCDTSGLLERIAAFRERLEKTPPLSKTMNSELLAESKTQDWAKRTDILAPMLRQFAAEDINRQPLPAHITLRVRQLLHTARELVACQRSITDDIFFARLASAADDSGEADPLVCYHRSTVAATDAALRFTQSFPSSAEFQTRMCAGLETMLEGVRDRLTIAKRALERRRRGWGRIERLTRLLCDLQARRLVPFSSFSELADEMILEARQGAPLRFPTMPATSLARFVATHSITTAEVVARIVPYDYEWATRPVVAVATALVMDVGMLAVPADLLAKTPPFDSADRSLLEGHVIAGVEWLRSVMPEEVVDAVAAHHERLDGTGYPHGRTGDRLPSLSRLMAVADTYAAAAADRPHRPAREPREALTETLTEAERGRLDHDFAELLLHLSFHPIGTVVELTDGRVAVVVATPTNQQNLRAAARPVVSVLTDQDRNVLPRPEVINLACAEFGAVVRALNSAERLALLAESYPDLCF